MASGFIVLPDGRCFSRHWSAHDGVLRALAEAMDSPSLSRWVTNQLPGPNDEEELGFGAWWRHSDDTVVRRFVDLRLMTEDNQRVFCNAVRSAASADHESVLLTKCLSELADMVARMERREPPLSRSDWSVVVPPEGDHIGPGWPEQ